MEPKVTELSDIASQKLSEVSLSLLLPLYIRATETLHPQAILRDQQAVELIQKLNIDSSSFNQARVSEEVRVSILLRNRQFDLITSAYLADYPEAVVVHLGCGLDTRFVRVDNGQVEWYDLDLPEVINLRCELIGGESERCHLLACSALDNTWVEAVSIHLPRPYLFLAEGLFMFFEQQQVIRLVQTLRDRFPSSELVFDAFSPFYAWGNNRRVARTHVGALAHWALKRGKELENLVEGVHLIDEWFPFLCPEPRLHNIRWVRYIPLLSKTTGIFHYRLG